MVVEIAVAVIAVAFVVLVGYLVATLIQVKKTVAESEQLISHLNADMPLLIKDLQGVTENARAMTDRAREGVEHAATLLHAVGEMGDAVHRVNEAVRGQSSHLLTNVTSVVAGLRAATSLIRQRLVKEGGNSDGR